jgi:hypothetical protein
MIDQVDYQFLTHRQGLGLSLSYSPKRSAL